MTILTINQGNSQINHSLKAEAGFLKYQLNKITLPFLNIDDHLKEKSYNYDCSCLGCAYRITCTTWLI
jgi:hypothetical protein